MPTLTYKCNDCDFATEEFLWKFDAKYLPICANNKVHKMQRKIVATNVLDSTKKPFTIAKNHEIDVRR